MKHFIKYDSNRPDIALSCVGCPLQNLRSHINGATHARFEHLRSKIVHILSESEIANFVNSFVYEDVGRFKISVNNALSHKLSKPA